MVLIFLNDIHCILIIICFVENGCSSITRNNKVSTKLDNVCEQFFLLLLSYCYRTTVPSAFVRMVIKNVIHLLTFIVT